MTQLAFPLDNVRFERQGGLTDRALALLGHGPAATAEVASRVMGITHGGGAAAAAVFALLGTDARFRVSADGVWSLAHPPRPDSMYDPLPSLSASSGDGGEERGEIALAGSAPASKSRRARKAPAEPPPPARPLRDEEWVVVDLETTGGSPYRGHRVTEVAAVRVAGGRITETYSTLVNPMRPIPGMITSLTGITQGMVANAPLFRDVAEEVSDAIRGRVFVAHNAAFDWRFLCHEMQMATGMQPRGRQLCTVRVARKLLPELPSRGLDALALYFGLRIESRHRALDDAVATAKLLIRFIDMLEERGAGDWNEVQTLLRNRAQRKKRTKSPRSMESA
ncbi:MAG TPA: 3'-5' exonuclease [Longimicrobium sp.]|nr:3'-5' exonuclease [Longimicrobium sp.]